MTSSLTIAADPTREHNHPATLPLTSGPIETRASAPFDEGRWDAWVAKGRRADAASTETMRVLAMVGVSVAAAVGTVWILFG